MKISRFMVLLLQLKKSLQLYATVIQRITTLLPSLKLLTNQTRVQRCVPGVPPHLTSKLEWLGMKVTSQEPQVHAIMSAGRSNSSLRFQGGVCP